MTLNDLRAEHKRALASAWRLELEAGAYREAYAAGGSLGPDAFYATLGKATLAVRLLERAISKAREQKREAT